MRWKMCFSVRHPYPSLYTQRQQGLQIIKRVYSTKIFSVRVCVRQVQNRQWRWCSTTRMEVGLARAQGQQCLTTSTDFVLARTEVGLAS